MGTEETVLNLDSVRALKRDIQESLEREVRGKSSSLRGPYASAAPRAFANNRDVFGMLDDLVPNTPQGKSTKRKGAFDTPGPTKTARSADFSSPAGDTRTPHRGIDKNGSLQSTPFSQRQNSGQVLETINSHLDPPERPVAPYSEPRIKLTANTDIKKFAYKPMAMRLSEASEVLDDRIDEFLALIQKHYDLEDTAFGNPASQSTKEIIAVGRIASDSLEGKLNTSSLVLETSRRTGAGLRVPLKVDSLPSVQFFPGQIVALRGINASKEYFSVLEVLKVPFLPTPVSTPGIINSVNERLEAAGSQSPLNILLASGPYTADNNLDFEPLKTLCERATDECVDALILTGPFLDLEHPMIASGDINLPDIHGVDPDTATLSTLFRYYISAPLQQLATAIPSITIILVPSVRDAVSKHVSWPQEMLPKRELGLPKQARMVPNPVTLSLNESVFGLCSHDVLYELRQEEVIGGKPPEASLLDRLPRYLIEQRHFSPVFPPTSREHLPKPGVDGSLVMGAMIDLRFLKLGEWRNVRPDVLITPSVLPPFVKVVESVLVINPGTLSKRRGPGTFAQIALHWRKLTDEEQNENQVSHKVYERAKVDIIRI
ncbi:hypothetical protein VTO42DRAFT_7854 [Malbranchea cinnamomea]